MTDKEIIEELKLFYLKIYNNNASIQIEKVTEETLKNLFNTCVNNKYMEEVTNYYTDKECPDFNNWVNVEGEGYGSLWLKEEDDESKWHELIKESLLKFIEIKSKNSFNEYVLIINTEDKVIYHFIERIFYNRDILYTFSNNELFY